MTVRVRIRKRAEIDILDAARYYERKQETLGRQFCERIDDAIQLIREHREVFPVCLGKYRRALIKQFPYALYYQIEMEEIVVVAVLHQRQDNSQLFLQKTE